MSDAPIPLVDVVLVEDHLIVRDGLRALLELRRDLRVVGESGDGIDGLALVKASRPDLVFVDLNLPRLDGAELIASAKAATASKFIVLTSIYDEIRARHAISAGADAFLHKTCSRAELYAAIDQVLQHSDPLLRLLESDTPNHPVTSAELRVLRAIKAGRTNEQIAQDLSISANTVKTHIGHIFRKLNVSNRTGALAEAQSRGIV